MYRDKNNVTHITTNTVEMKETECKMCLRPLQYRPEMSKPPTCVECVHTLIESLGDKSAQASVYALAQSNRLGLKEIQVNIRYGNEGPNGYTRETVKVTPKIRELAHELILTKSIR